MRHSLLPNSSLISLVRGARHLAEQEALDGVLGSKFHAILDEFESKKRKHAAELKLATVAMAFLMLRSDIAAPHRLARISDFITLCQKMIRYWKAVVNGNLNFV